MEEDWQSLDSEKPVPKIVDVNKWEGEDEDDDIKDSWDLDDEEKKDEEKATTVAKPKKTLQQKIAEKEQKRLEAEEKRRLEKEAETSNLSPEELRKLKQLQEEADLKTALDTLGLTTVGSVDASNPTTKEEFAEFSDALIKRINQHKAKEEYLDFLDDFVRNLLASLPSSSIRKVKTSIDNLYLEKQKIEKGDKPKKKGVKAKGVKLRMEGEDDYSSRAGAFEADDFDDFM